MRHLSAWAQRYSQLETLIAEPSLAQAREEALRAASLIPQTDDNAASAVTSHQVSLALVDGNCREERLGRELDTSLAVLWSAPLSSRDVNGLRRVAQHALKPLLQLALSESSRDLAPITCLESNREGTVELVRCTLDRRIYVLKSTTKGAAKRGYRSNAPVTERRLLSLSRQSKDEALNARFTPACIAAFQSPGSLHILMDYCPAGDLYHFLESAGEAPLTNEARNRTGGLLSERYVKRYAIDMVAAISWIHEQGFMHRDIKPGNWLFDNSGHLILCDLASAAPFRFFDHVPCSGNLPERDEWRTSKVRQRRVLYRHCCLIGTADYIAPEIFWTADLMSRRRERRLNREQSQTSASHCSEDESQSDDERGEGDSDSDSDSDEPPPDGPGLYGPECDWWSLGVVLFEMVYKRMPFFSEKVAETMEMIKHHERYFRLDSWVQCSKQLQSLIQGLVCQSEKRLGYVSSGEVKSHALFAGVDWERPWMGDSVPFVPKLEIGNPAASWSEASVLQQEPSVLHSPRYNHDMTHSTHFSQMWSGNPKDFPAFPNSVEMSRAVAGKIVEEQEDEGGEGEEGDSEATITNSSPSTRKALQQQTSSRLIEVEAQWASFDPTWIGFSFVPARTAFQAVVAENQASLEGLPSPISSPGNSSDGHNILYSPQDDSMRLPLVSTPCHSSEETSQEVVPVQSTPFHPSVALSLHRRAVETASRVRSETVDQDYHQSFATPLRKTSMPNLATANDRQQMMANLKTPANPSWTTLNVPPSPYPFPVATVSRPTKTPAAPRVPSSGLRRADLERARSASAETGEGSDSRCSGGSNIKRDISEREAWRELKVAVMQSARKGRHDPVKELEEEKRGGAAARRLPLAHAAVDGIQPPADHVSQPRQSSKGAAEEKSMLKRASASGLGALGGALIGKRPSLPRFLSHELRIGKRAPLKPVMSMTSPERPASIVSTSSTSSSPPSYHHEEEAEAVGTAMSARSRLLLPGFWNRQGEGSKLAKKRSARQLLLKAQDRETPTKIASRSGSPFLTSFQNLSLGSNTVSGGSSASIHGTDAAITASPSARAELQDPAEPKAMTKAIAMFDSDDSGTSSQRSSPKGDADPRRSTLPQSAMIVQLKREEVSSVRQMRRRDSREMLSQYRQGINPDETMEHMPPFSRQTRDLSVNILQPTSTNQQVGDGSSLSSPSLPSFPDAFGGNLESKGSQQELRRASMIPVPAWVPKGEAKYVEAGPFRSLQSRRSSRVLQQRSSSGKLSIRPAIMKGDVQRAGEGKGEEGGKADAVGDVSMMSGLDWRYESIRENLSQVEDRLERIKARLRED